MAILSLNGNFNYPVEIKQNLIVDGNAEFNNVIQHGSFNKNSGQYSFTSGENCEANSKYSFSAGNNSYTGANAIYSRSDGFQCSSYGEYSRSYGYNAAANSDRAFVWQGVETDNKYQSKGEGTFCINPEFPLGSEPICGFYIGDSCITEYISSHSAKRILKNPNVGDGAFEAPQEFVDNVFLSGPVTSKSQFTFSGDVFFNGNTYVENNSDINSTVSRAIASIEYARGIALSAVSNLSGYYPLENISEVDFEEMKNFSVPLHFLKSYVTSSINNPKAFYSNVEDDNFTIGGTNAATRDYTFSLASSASTHTLTSNNSFIGKNSFGTVEIIGRNVLSLSNTASADFRNGSLLLRETSNFNDTIEYMPATERFARGVATSGVYHILNDGNTYGNNSSVINTYNATSRFYGPVTFYNAVSLDSSAVANFIGGTLYIKSPSKNAMSENEPSTTKFTRDTALSAIDTFLRDGGEFSDKSELIFNGTLTFNTTADFRKSNDSEIFVKTKNIALKTSDVAASTKYVEDYITNTISTSALSVKKLITKGNESSSINDFTTTNKFLNENIYVSTMPITCDDTHAASCEYVNLKCGSMDAFDLFDVKFIDYILPQSSNWKMSGSVISKNEHPDAYAHIYNDMINGTQGKLNLGGSSNGITYYQAIDGHKIIPYNNTDMTKIKKYFSTTGVAWYYFIDTTPRSERIMLPRSKYGFNIFDVNENASIDLAKNIGTYIEPALPSHAHSFRVPRSADGEHGDSTAAHHGGSSTCSVINGTTDQVINSIYKVGATVQPPATKMFLYFYCGKKI